ncbi:hypothetical protein B0H13DRAFT_2667123 [Mycena leptocephala]|nr:hypothetical protein B0H13DRAFT_2667123 [Mycena leptocephala]
MRGRYASSGTGSISGKEMLTVQILLLFLAPTLGGGEVFALQCLAFVQAPAEPSCAAVSASNPFLPTPESRPAPAPAEPSSESSTLSSTSTSSSSAASATPPTNSNSILTNATTSFTSSSSNSVSIFCDLGSAVHTLKPPLPAAHLYFYLSFVGAFRDFEFAVEQRLFATRVHGAPTHEAIALSRMGGFLLCLPALVHPDTPTPRLRLFHLTRISARYQTGPWRAYPASPNARISAFSASTSASIDKTPVHPHRR